MALGAYTTMVVTIGKPVPPVEYVLGWSLPFLVAIPVAMVVVVALAAIVGAIALRNLREIYFAITTLGATEAGIPAGEVKDLAAVYDGPDVREQGLVWGVDHSTLGHVELPGNPLQFSRTAVAPGLPPPVLGEHTEAVRAWILGDQAIDSHVLGA
jgi:CoA-transferase family III